MIVKRPRTDKAMVIDQLRYLPYQWRYPRESLNVIGWLDMRSYYFKALTPHIHFFSKDTPISLIILIVVDHSDDEIYEAISC